MNTTSERNFALQSKTLQVLSVGPRTCLEIALELGISERKARHAIQALSDEGRIRLSGRKRMPNRRRHAYLFARVA